MSVWINEQTFLILSFILAGWALYKLTYRKLDKWTKDEIDKIKEALQDSENAQADAEIAINDLKIELNKITEEAKDNKKRLHQEIKKIARQSEEKIAMIIATKEQEYQYEKAKIEYNSVFEMLNALMLSFMQRMKDRIKDAKADDDFHKNAVNNSINMLEGYISKVQ